MSEFGKNSEEVVGRATEAARKILYNATWAERKEAIQDLVTALPHLTNTAQRIVAAQFVYRNTDNGSDAEERALAVIHQEKADALLPAPELRRAAHAAFPAL